MNIFQIRNIRNKQTINRNRFNIEFVGLDSKLRAASNSEKGWIRHRYMSVMNALGTGTFIDQSLSISLKSATVPNVAVDTARITRFNDSIIAPTKFADMPEFTCSFYDYVDGSASAIMQLWFALVGDKRTGAIGFKSDFVLPQAYFYVYGPDAPGYELKDGTESDASATVDEIPWLQKYELWNLFPLNIDLGEHSDDAAPREISVTFNIDNIFPVGIRSYNSESDYGSAGYSAIPGTAENGRQWNYAPSIDEIKSFEGQ